MRHSLKRDERQNFRDERQNFKESIGIVARYKQRQRELRQDKFRDTTTHFFERLGDRLEGKGRLILYGLAAVLLVCALVGIFRWQSGRRANEARQALASAIELQQAQVNPSPQPSPATQPAAPTFPTEQARAEAANQRFQNVVQNYGSPYSHIARYFIAANLLTLDRNRGISELENLSKSGEEEIASPAKFSLAGAYEADSRYDQAANLYRELLNEKDSEYPSETLNLRLATIYDKQGKRQEAVDTLFKIVEAARKAQGADGKPARQSLAATDAAKRLQTLDPARYAQLPPEPTPANPFG